MIVITGGVQAHIYLTSIKKGQNIKSDMPKVLEKSLKRTAKKRGYGEKRTGAYVYGTMRRMGWSPKRKSKSKKK